MIWRSHGLNAVLAVFIVAIALLTAGHEHADPVLVLTLAALAAATSLRLQDDRDTGGFTVSLAPCFAAAVLLDPASAMFVALAGGADRFGSLLTRPERRRDDVHTLLNYMVSTAVAALAADALFGPTITQLTPRLLVVPLIDLVVNGTLVALDRWLLGDPVRPFVGFALRWLPVELAASLVGLIIIAVYLRDGTLGVALLIVPLVALQAIVNWLVISRRRVEQERERARFYLDQADVPVFVVGSDNQVLETSRAARRLFGTPTGATWQDWLLHGLGPAARRQIEGVAEGFVTEPDDVQRMTFQTGATGSIDRDLRWTATRLDAQRLGTAGWLLAARDTTEERRAREEASRDALTGLANRRGLDRHLNSGVPIRAVMLIDLDRFKQVNDQLGHEVGDALLVAVAGRLSQAVRGPDDLIARLGGDEFVIVLGAGRWHDPQGDAVAARVRAALQAPFQLGSVRVTVGASVGVQAMKPGLDPDEALRVADAQMYAAKRARSAQSP